MISLDWRIMSLRRNAVVQDPKHLILCYYNFIVSVK
jgi:hypothetical protein